MGAKMQEANAARTDIAPGRTGLYSVIHSSRIHVEDSRAA